MVVVVVVVTTIKCSGCGEVISCVVVTVVVVVGHLCGGGYGVPVYGGT